MEASIPTDVLVSAIVVGNVKLSNGPFTTTLEHAGRATNNEHVFSPSGLPTWKKRSTGKKPPDVELWKIRMVLH